MIDYLEKLHLCPRHPENHNLQVHSLDAPYMYAFNGRQWDAKSKEKLLNEIVIDGCRVLDEHLDDNMDDLEKTMRHSELDRALRFYTKRLNTSEDNLDAREKIYAELVSELHLLLFNKTREFGLVCK